MDERERFYKYFKGAMPGNKTYERHMIAGWDARAEISKQDEKELIDALKYYANNQHVKKNIRQGKEFIEVENGEIAKMALEKLNG